MIAVFLDLKKIWDSKTRFQDIDRWSICICKFHYNVMGIFPELPVEFALKMGVFYA